MEPLDLKKIQSLLSDNFDDDHVDDNDLEDELEAILSGRAVSKAKPTPLPRTVESSRKSHVRQAPAPPTQNVYNKNVKSRAKVSQDNILDISNIQKMINNFDLDNEAAEDEIEENDEDLLSELNSLVGNSASSKRTKPEMLPEPLDPSPVASNAILQPNMPIRPVKTPKLEPQAIPESFNVVPPNSLPTPINLKLHNNSLQQKAEHVKQLQLEYKRAALQAKNVGDKTTALSHMKQLDVMLQGLSSGQDVDISTLPPKPDKSLAKPTSSAPVPSSILASQSEPSSDFEQPEMSQEEAAKIFNAPTTAGSVLEALEQRLAKFTSTYQQAEAENNSSKVRRLGRIMKQYQTAIKDHKAGKPVVYDDLPCPPGFPPIPVNVISKPVAPQPSIPVEKSKLPQPNQPQATNPKHARSESEPPAPPLTSAQKRDQRPVLTRGISTTANKQLNYLLERQRLFKEAALGAKKRGEIEQAKEYLKCAKGFDPLIAATRNGLPIDATSIPTPPQLNNDDFVIINAPSEKEITSGNTTSPSNSNFYLDSEREELFRRVEKELQDQVEMCNRNKEYFLKLGDIATSSKFEKYAKESKKDLNMLIIRWRNGDNVPSYQTEMRTFSIVVSNPEVGINEVHVEVLKAFDLPGKPEIDTYVKLEFPFPTEKTQQKKTKTVYNSLNPEYNETVKFEIDRKSRSLSRVLKRHPLKLEIFSKGGFLRSDTVIGLVQVKLSDFDTKCTLHECFPLTEGRKIINGRLEVKVKIREPLLSKQIEEIREKWIVFS